MALTIPFDPDHIPIIPLETGHVRLALVEGASEVVVCFEPADTRINRRDLKRTGFGEEFLNKNGYSVISVMTNTANWYRSADYPTFFSSVYLQAILQRFSKAHGYGSSMGAFGALAYADMLHLNTIVAYMPVSSLRADIVPWETRFEPGRALDWSGGFSDAAEGIKNLKNLWVFYDPTNVDACHAKRLDRPDGLKTRHIHFPGAGHAVPAVLKREGLLKQAVMTALSGGDPDLFRAKLKSCNLTFGSKL